MRMALVVLSFPMGPLVLRGSDRKQLLGKWFAVFQWAIGLRTESSTRNTGLTTGHSPESVT
jgi:hypothetical protein